MTEGNLFQLVQSAARLQLEGKLPQAREAFEQILSRNPNHAEAMNLLGVVYCQLGEFDRGVQLIHKSIALQPNNPLSHCNLAYVYYQTGQSEQAIAAYQKAIELKPDFFEARYSLGLAHVRIGQLDLAIAEFRAALGIRPGAFTAQHELGVALRLQGRFDEAIGVLRKAIAERLQRCETLKQTAQTLRGQGREKESQEAFKAAMGAKPALASAYNTLAATYALKGNSDEALNSIQKSLEIAPEDAAYHCNRASILKDMGRADLAAASYAMAISLDPDNPVIHSNWLYIMNFHPDYDAARIFDESRRWNARHGVPLVAERKPLENDRSPERTLRVGFVSPDFRGHAIGRSLVALMRHHARSEFQFYCYGDSPNFDAVTETLKQSTDHWRQIVGFSHARLCETIRQDKIDILFDLTLHMSNNRLPAFAAKPAPVQFTWAGYPGTTGLDAIDYRLTDPYLDPPGPFDQYYAEKSLRLPATFWCLDLQTLEALQTPEVNPLPSLQRGFITFGCLNNFSKVNQRVLDLWRKVLDAVANSRMILLTPPGSAREWVRQSLGDRVEFVGRLPHDAYLRVNHQIDIGLDTLPYNGHMTSLDSLWMGVPIVTLPGKTVVGRGGMSILKNLGLEELIATSEDDFVRIAGSLAGDLGRLAAMRASLRDRMRASPILDGRRFAADFQVILRKAWRDWCAANRG